MRICELHQKYPGQHFPNCKCDTEHEGAVFCDFHKKYPNQWLASCDCGVEEKKLRLKGHKFPEAKAHQPTILQASRLLRPVQRKKVVKKKGRKARQPKKKG